MPAATAATRERDRLLAEAKRLTEGMADATERRKQMGVERRALLLALNREHNCSYRRLQHETGLSSARLVQEIAKAKDEAGITEQHPRYPAFGNGDS